MARAPAPRHAFTRACKKPSDQRIIRPVAEDAATIRFQFTQESRCDDKFEYTLETMLTLDKRTGSVSCELPGLATLAQEELDRCTAVRTGGDGTRAVQKLFARQADLFPIRPQAEPTSCRNSTRASWTGRRTPSTAPAVGGSASRCPSAPRRAIAR